MYENLKLFTAISLAFLLTGSVLARGDDSVRAGAQSTQTILSQGVTGAVVNRDFTCNLFWVDVSGNSVPVLPFGSGIVLVPVENAQAVSTPGGRINLHCSGVIPYGAEMTVTDASTGLPVEATLATFEEMCDEVNLAFPGTCRGKNGAAIITDQPPSPCVFFGNETFDRFSVYNRNGQAQLTCHFE